MEEIAQFAAAAQEEIRHDVGWLFRGAIRVILECLLEQEVKEMVGARRYERLGSRKDHLNGTYLRRLLTSMGSVELTVPRTRQSGSPSGVVGRYKRRTEDMDRLMTTAYVQGVSTRDMTKLSKALMGEGVSRSTVSRATKVLEEQVEALRRSPIDKPVPYLYLDATFLDATFLDARWARSVENVSALVAYGVDSSGHRRLLGISIGTEESEASWSELLGQLCERGLSGVELVIADEHRGLANAVRRQLPEARRQRCTVHLERNVLSKVPHRLRARVAKQLRSIFDAPSAAEAKTRLHEFASGLGRQLPEAPRCLEQGLSAATQFYAFPKEHWIRIRSTNGLERLHGEIKRRIRSVGAFPDHPRPVSRRGRRRYLEMSSLKKTTAEKPIA